MKKIVPLNQESLDGLVPPIGLRNSPGNVPGVVIASMPFSGSIPEAIKELTEVIRDTDK